MGAEIKLPAKQVRYAEGNGVHLGNAENKTISFRTLSALFAVPTVTRESFADYKAASDDEQGKLKRMPGWVLRCHTKRGKRAGDSILPGDMITLDIDTATPQFSEDLLTGKILPGTALFAHTTRSHTPEKPRWRLFILADSEIDADHYPRACRMAALQYDDDLSMTDKVSARANQLMYRPSVSRDMQKHYRHYEQPGEPLDWMKLVHDWEKETGLNSDDITKLPRFKGEKELRDVSERVERPQTKKGPVGAWCRAYNCIDLVMGKDGEEPILGHVYEVSDWGQDGLPTRFSYVPGHSTNGVVVYEDGDLIYSHHGSDPATDRTLNSWDLCRYHLFDAARDDENLPMGKQESWKKMTEFAKDYPAYVQQLAEERFSPDLMALDVDDDLSWVNGHSHGDDSDEDDLTGNVDNLTTSTEQAELEDLLGVPMSSVMEDGPTPYERLRAVKPPKSWVASQLELTQDGAIKATLPNIATIITNDPRLFRKVAHNAFSNQTTLLHDIKTKNPRIPNLTCRDKKKGDRWTDFNDVVIRSILEMPPGDKNMGYGLKVSDRDLQGGIIMAARNNTFHPILDQIRHWREMGPPDKDPIPDFLPRHVGAERSEYTTQVLRTMLIASIARVTTPGCKFDYALILEGLTGIGKSTFIKLIYGEDYFGELDADLADRQATAEQTSGKWCLELPELGSLHKADYNHAKAFMRRQHDDVRMAYGRNVAELPRQFVTWGTTNDNIYLRDPTGNRSYWVVKCLAEQIDFAAVLREREDLWRQAVYDHDQLRARYRTGDMPLTLTRAALDRARELQEGARQREMWENWKDDILDWFHTPVRKGTLMASMGVDINELDDDFDQMVTRVAFNQHQAAVGALGLRDGAFTNPTQQTAWNKVLASLEVDGWIRWNCRIAGVQKRWIIFPEAPDADKKRGYVFADDAEHTQRHGAGSMDDLI
ncbi:virulence-associated E family protein [Ruegeria sp. SCP11]|uniref:virulence-associated E family protein n=1 Tax=Ruegeria sp. SCP11 TaxID=3141378 RepID=UPI00333C2B80